jgi:hypothetical protein
MRFEPKVKDEQIMQIAKEQNEIYNKWNFYDKFIKAREGVKKNEIKSNCIDWVIVVCGGDGDYGCLVSHCCFS